MELSDQQVATIIAAATSYLDHPYGPGFKCLDFVRKVYAAAGIHIPPIGPDSPLPGFNIDESDLADPPAGRIIFLKHKIFGRGRGWTHVGIIFPEGRCIHHSFFSGKVVITSLHEIFQKYDFAPSRPRPQ